MRRISVLSIVSTLLLANCAARAADAPQTLPGTERLDWEGDLAARMVEGVDRFLLKKLDEAVERRAEHWRPDFSSPEAYEKSIEPNRRRLAHILGLRDERVKFDALS